MAASSSNPPRVLLGISAGIAAYKACEVASRLVQSGCEVKAVMTPRAKRFVGALTLAALTGHPVPEDDWFESGQEATIGHIDLARWAQAVVVAPATADLMARHAAGLADDLLSTILLATNAPIIMAPAMNPQMYAHPATQANVATLAARGVRLLGPAVGHTACGEEGPGRMVEPALILDHVWDLLLPQDLAGRRVLISAGPTREHLDPVRFISNPSSGRMGIELARAARQRGAAVTLVLGPTSLEPPDGVAVERVTSAAQMAQAILARAPEADLIIKAAAVADQRPAQTAPQKVKKEAASASLELAPTTDILAQLGRDKRPGQVLVGFAAETERVEAHGRSKLERKNLDLICANDVGRSDAGFATATNQVVIIGRDVSPEVLPLLTKAQTAHRILDRAVALMTSRA